MKYNKISWLSVKQKLVAYLSTFTPHEGIREIHIIPKNGSEINIISLKKIEVNIVQEVKSMVWNNRIKTDRWK
jgi:hypothetical protein